MERGLFGIMSFPLRARQPGRHLLALLSITKYSSISAPKLHSFGLLRDRCP